MEPDIVPLLADALPFAACAAVLAIGLGLAVLVLVGRRRSLPSRWELLASNLRLAEEQAKSLALMGMLQEANQQLERRVAERTRELDLERRRFETALTETGITVAEQDADLRYTWIYNPPMALGGRPLVGRLPEEVLPEPTAAAQGALKRRVLATGTAAGFEIALPAHGRMAWYEGRAEPIVEDGRVAGVLTVAIDITRHKQHEREIRDVMRELTHRSKNLMAVIQGIARQTAIGASDLPSFLAALDGRLQALSRVHGLLVEEFWRGAWLLALIERERQPDDGGPPLAVLLDGQDFRLSPEAAQNFALALYELFSDARSAPDGAAATFLGWSESDGRFLLEWNRPGPPSPSLTAGFGRIFLERHMPISVGGRALLTISPERTRYRLEAPAAALHPPRGLSDRPDGTEGGAAR